MLRVCSDELIVKLGFTVPPTLLVTADEVIE